MIPNIHVEASLRPVKYHHCYLTINQNLMCLVHQSYRSIFRSVCIDSLYLDLSRPPQAYGRDLAEAYEWCKKFQATNNVKDLTQAWELYHHVLRRIPKQLPQVCLCVCVCVHMNFVCYRKSMLYKKYSSSQ